MLNNEINIAVPEMVIVDVVTSVAFEGLEIITVGSVVSGATTETEPDLLPPWLQSAVADRASPSTAVTL